MPDAGWYDDPLVPGGKRFWDGLAWTPNVQGPGAPPAIPPTPPPQPPPGLPPSIPPGSGAIQGQTPPFEPIPASVAATGGFMADGTFGEIGAWLNQTFRVLRDNAVELLLLFFVIPAVFWCIGYLSMHQFVAELNWLINDSRSEVTGVNASLAVISLVAFAAMFIAWLVGMVAGHHLLYGAHVGSTPSVGTSFLVGLKRLPRLLVISLLLTIGVVLIIAIPQAIVVLGITTGGSSAVALVALAVVIGLLLAPLLVWLWVKTSFIWVSAAVVPSGTSALSSSFGVSRGRFWQAFVRLGILFAMTTMLSSVIQVFVQFAAPVVLFSKFDTDDRGRLLIDGRDIGSIDELQIADLLPNPIAALVYFTVFVLITAAGQALVASGTSALYASAKAPNSFGVGDGSLGNI